MKTKFKSSAWQRRLCPPQLAVTGRASVQEPPSVSCHRVQPQAEEETGPKERGVLAQLTDLDDYNE
jgi:hypothetical protein